MTGPCARPHTQMNGHSTVRVFVRALSVGLAAILYSGSGSLADEAYEQPLLTYRVDGLAQDTPVMTAATPRLDCADEVCDLITSNTDMLVDMGMAYNRQITDAVNIGVNATYIAMEASPLSLLVPQDPEAWSVGGNIGVKGFTLLGSYKASANILGDGAAHESWDVGASYERGAWGMTLSYAEDDCTSCDLSAVDFGEETSAFEGGVDYQLGTGVSFGGAVQYIEKDSVSAAEDETSIFLETMISF